MFEVECTVISCCGFWTGGSSNEKVKCLRMRTTTTTTTRQGRITRGFLGMHSDLKIPWHEVVDLNMSTFSSSITQTRSVQPQSRTLCNQAWPADWLQVNCFINLVWFLYKMTPKNNRYRYSFQFQSGSTLAGFSQSSESNP